MKKNTRRVFETGALSGIAMPNEDIRIPVFYYVKRIVNGNATYLNLSKGEYKFTGFSEATSFSEEEAIRLVNAFQEYNITTSVFRCSKKPSK